MQNHVEALRKCRNGVAWKGSVQDYTFHAITEIYKKYSTLHKGKLPKETDGASILLNERGKVRKIVPVTIRDRVTQRALCDNSLLPVLTNTLIYDNGASLKDKGVEFTRRRLRHHLKAAIQEYGPDFYVGIFDFTDFFGSIPHRSCLNVLNDAFRDERIKQLTMGVIKSYEKARTQKLKDLRERKERLRKLNANQAIGICLGSQVSQIEALAVPNKLDHLIKDGFGVKHYLRYMDDGVIFSKSKKFLHRIFTRMKAVCDQMGLKFNMKKTRIVKASRGFVFLKVRHRVTSRGKIVQTLVRSGAVRMRRKLKRFSGLVEKGRMSLEDVYQSVQSWFAHTGVASAYRTRGSMMKLYYTLFGKSWRGYNRG